MWQVKRGRRRGRHSRLLSLIVSAYVEEIYVHLYKDGARVPSDERLYLALRCSPLKLQAQKLLEAIGLKQSSGQ